MSTTMIWLFIFVSLYWAFCIFWGIRASRKSTGTAGDFFIGSRGLSPAVFVLAITSASLAGWSFISHPGLVLQNGFQYINASFYVIAIPLAGVLFMKRQWMLGKRFGYLTAGEMFADYFKGHTIRIVSVGIALLFAIPFLATLLGASGYIVSELSEGYVSRDFAMWILSLVVLLYLVTGGLEAVAKIGAVQCVLFGLGVILIGLYGFNVAGGFDSLNQGLARIAQTPVSVWGPTDGNGGGDYDGYFVIPGVIQWVDGLGKEAPAGGPWTAIMCLTFMISMMGVQCSPAFSIWGFASRTPRAFGIHQVWASAFCVGLILFFFSSVQGLAAVLLGANAQVNEAGLAIDRIIPELGPGQYQQLVIHYINAMGEKLPWLVGALAVCVIAAIQSTGGAIVLSSSSVVTRDIYKRYMDPDADDHKQRLAGRIIMLLIMVAAMLVATYAQRAMISMAALAIAFSLQLLPSLLSVAWFPWITRQGATLGLIAGLVVVVMTDSLGQTLTGGSLPWGRWPWTIHSAGWGIFFNVAVCILVSALSRKDAQLVHRMKFHNFLREHASLPDRKRRLKPVAWVMSLVWMFFAVGPGAVLGNFFFGEPDQGYEGWALGMPSIWGWQLIWWLLGVGMIWWLAYKMEMSTDPVKEIVVFETKRQST